MHYSHQSFEVDPSNSDMLELLFDRIPMGIVVLTPDFRIVRFNPTWAGFCQRNSPDADRLLRPGAAYFAILPLARSTLEPLFKRALQGETVRENALCIPTHEYATYCHVMVAPLMQANIICGILVAGTDVTEQVESRQALQNALQELQHSHEVVEQRVEERTRELKTLITIQQALTSSLKLDEVLHIIAEEARRLTNTDVGAVFMPDNQYLVLAAISSSYPTGIEPGYRMSLTNSVTGTAFRTGQTQLVKDIRGHPGVDPNALTMARIRSILSVPLISGTRTIGVLSVGNKLDGQLSAEDERLLTLMVPSAVIALDNVRVYERASETAIAAERGRLARDLHDSVTQTLFSASLTAEVLPRIWARDPDEGMIRLEKLRELTRGAMAEMRTLLLELRPAALVEMPLGDLLQQLAAGIAGRTRIDIAVMVNGSHDPLPEVKIALYRIAQEALNNVAKHSKARTVNVTLTQLEQHIELNVTDDGIGFDPTANRASHLGLRIMVERADAIGAVVHIATRRNKGTQIKTVWVGGEFG